MHTPQPWDKDHVQNFKASVNHRQFTHMTIDQNFKVRKIDMDTCLTEREPFPRIMVDNLVFPSSTPLVLFLAQLLPGKEI